MIYLSKKNKNINRPN